MDQIRGRILLAAFYAILVPLLVGATCSASKNEGRLQEQATIHYDLGVQALQNSDPRSALTEYQKALELDPKLDLAHNALGLVYQFSFGQLDKAIEHYKKALQINAKFSEAAVNLGTAYLEQSRFDEAIELFKKALGDILYRTPYIAENNLGWALHKKGETKAGVEHIKRSLVAFPKFCIAHRNLGIIFSEAGDHQKAALSFESYAKHCPEIADARYRFGRALLAAGDLEGARKEFEVCKQRGANLPLGEDCKRLVEGLDK